MADHITGPHQRPADVAGVRISPAARPRLDENRNGAISGAELDKGLRSGLVTYKDHVVVPNPSKKPAPQAALFDEPAKAKAPQAAKSFHPPADWSETKALRDDIRKVAAESYNPPKVQVEDAQSKALRDDIKKVAAESYNPPKAW